MLLALEIGRMVEILKADMQETQIDFFINHILTDYYAYKISDLTAFTKWVMDKKFYGSPKLQDIIKYFDLYSCERDEMAVHERAKENSQHKAEPIESDKVLKFYEKMKGKKDKKKTQKEKDIEAQQSHAEKLKEFEKLYGNKAL